MESTEIRTRCSQCNEPMARVRVTVDTSDAVDLQAPDPLCPRCRKEYNDRMQRGGFDRMVS